MRKIPLTIIMLLAAFFVALSGQAQIVVDDLHMDRKQRNDHPELRHVYDSLDHLLEHQTQLIKQFPKAKRAGNNDIIPVVFHILHQNGAENISDAQVHDAIRVLNEDFQFRNSDTAAIVPAFDTIAASMNLEFRLAKRDPDGNPTSGINRIPTALTEDAGESSKIVVWPRESYLNIWVVKSIASGAAGYTYLPGTANNIPSRDGIIVLYNYVGSIGSGNFRRSHTLTHEIGHWLNLPHPWGFTNSPGESGNCGSDDNVHDTPNTIGWTSCSLSGESCGSLDNVQNFMEYSYCTNMFTQGQVDRMQASLNSTVAQRSNLISTSNLQQTGVIDLWASQFSASNYAPCQQDTIHLTDHSYFDQNSWSWDVSHGVLSDSIDQHPYVVVNRPGLYDASLEVGNGSVTKEQKATQFYRVNPSQGVGVPYIETFENKPLPWHHWVAVNDNFDHVYWKRRYIASATDGISYWINNGANDYYTKEELISASIDASHATSGTITFDYAHAQNTLTNTDGLTVYTSTDCGKTWSIRWRKVGADLRTTSLLLSGGDYFPASADWTEASIELKDHELVPNLMVKFTVENGGGGPLYLDNFKFTGPLLDSMILDFPFDQMTGVDTAAKLDWKHMAFVDAYVVELDTTNTFSSSLLERDTTEYLGLYRDSADTEYTPDQLLAGTTYFWRVRALRNDTLPWSPVWSFTVSNNGVGRVSRDSLVIPKDYFDEEDIADGSIAPPASTEDASDVAPTFSVFPNPTNDRVTLRTSFGNITNLRLIDPIGRTVLSKTFENGGPQWEVDMAHLNPGTYILYIRTENGYVGIKRIIKE